MKPLSLCVLLLAAISVPFRAQRAVPHSFDVASVKPNRVGGDSRRAGTSVGGNFTAVNVTLKLLISRAYGVPEAQIEGGPGWVDTETFDIAAKADTPLEMTREEVRPCLQAILAERFRLTIHRQPKQGAIYSLVLAKTAPKFHEHSGSGAGGIGVSSGSGIAAIAATRTTMARLAEYLGSQTERPVVDDTGLKGEYDFRVEWSPEEKPNSPRPSLFTALQEQLGLKLNAAKGTIQMVVIDRAEMPSAN